MRSGTLLRSVRTLQVCRGLNSSALSTNFYNSDQLALQETTRRVLEEVINQDWQDWEKEKIFVLDIFIIELLLSFLLAITGELNQFHINLYPAITK